MHDRFNTYRFQVTESQGSFYKQKRPKKLLHGVFKEIANFMGKLQ